MKGKSETSRRKGGKIRRTNTPEIQRRSFRETLTVEQMMKATPKCFGRSITRIRTTIDPHEIYKQKRLILRKQIPLPSSPIPPASMGCGLANRRPVSLVKILSPQEELQVASHYGSKSIPPAPHYMLTESHKSSLRKLAAMYETQNRFDLSSVVYEKLISSYHDMESYQAMGLRYQQCTPRDPRAYLYYLVLVSHFQNDPTMLTSLATSFLNGKEPNVFNCLSFRILTACHELGIIEASYTLGVMYRDAIYVKKDGKKALSYFQHAVNRGSHPSSLNNIGLMYSQGFGKTPANQELAFQYIKLAAELKEKKGCFNVALLYEIGQGCERDLEKAKEYYKEAATLGFKLANKHHKLVSKRILIETTCLGQF